MKKRVHVTKPTNLNLDESCSSFKGSQNKRASVARKPFNTQGNKIYSDSKARRRVKDGQSFDRGVRRGKKLTRLTCFWQVESKTIFEGVYLAFALLVCGNFGSFFGASALKLRVQLFWWGEETVGGTAMVAEMYHTIWKHNTINVQCHHLKCFPQTSHPPQGPIKAWCSNIEYIIRNKTWLCRAFALFIV